MKALKAYYNGKEVIFDKNEKIPDNSNLILIVLENDADFEKDWSNLSSYSLYRAYSENEKDYSISKVKESNPDYESG